MPPCRRPERGPHNFRAVASLVALSLLLLFDGADAGAQHVRGRLLDLTTGAAIPVGFLSLLDEDSTVVATSISDANGLWQLNAPRAGAYYVAAERIGYRRWISGPVRIGATDGLESVFHLQPLAVALDTVVVEAEIVRRYLEYNGFFERQRGSFGHFISPDDIEKRQAARVSDLLTAIPGVQRVAINEGSVGPMQIQLRGSSLSQGGVCRPRVFVDGLIYTRGDSRPVRRREGVTTEREEAEQRMDQALSLDDIGHPSTIAAIEVYRSAAQVPVQFGGASVETLCGVIVVWTRSGRQRSSGR